MKKGKLVYLGLAICLIASMLAFGCAKPAPAPAPTPTPAPAPAPAPKPPPKPAEPIVLKAIQFLPVGHAMAEGGPMWIDVVNKACGGELVVELLGGPEVVPTFDQFEAMRSGVADINFNVSSFYTSVLPQCDVTHLTEYTASEERERGFYDFMVEQHEGIGVRYLARYMPVESVLRYLWVNKPVSTPYDMAGLKMRAGGADDEFYKALGVKGVTIASPDVYTALERGTVDGFAWPDIGIVDLGWHEVTKCCIDHGYFKQNGVVLMNLDSWNKIPKHLQDKILDLGPSFEQEVEKHFSVVEQEERQKMLDVGMAFIKFSTADAEWYVNLAHTAAWEVTKEKVSPEIYAQLRGLLTK